MEQITKLLEVVSGYKTFLAGAIAIGLGIYQNNTELIMLGLVAMGLRSAIK
jgi:hypothetical protein